MYAYRSFADQIAKEIPSQNIIADILDNKEIIRNDDQETISLLSEDEEANLAPNDVSTDAPGENHLRTFLASSMLTTDTEATNGENDEKVPMVTISTCHSAKGLEWPVVFVPAGD